MRNSKLEDRSEEVNQMQFGETEMKREGDSERQGGEWERAQQV